MFFFLSKTLNYLAQPLVIILIVVIAARLIRNAKYKKWLYIAAVALFFLFGNQFISNEILRRWELPIKPFAEINKTYDYGVLLTGITKAEVGPTDRVYFARGADRATHTLQLYRMGIIKKIIISGGSGRLIDIGVREADELAEFMVMAGVPREDLILENQSDNTHESAVEVKKKLEQLEGGKDFLLITSNFHMRRSLACFQKVGLQPDPFPVDPMSFPSKYSLDILLIPKLDAMANWQTLLKEWVGLTAYWMAGYV